MMELDNLHTNAKKGTLTLTNISQILIQVEVNDEDEYGDTALDLAIQNGHVGAVKLLLQNGADANRVGANGRTPLYSATQALNSGRIVELLLKHGAKPDEPVSQPKLDTPLMSAIRQGTSSEAIRALIKAGSSMNNVNILGETPAILAERSTNTNVHKAIRPKDEQPDWKPELESLLVSASLFALAYFKNFKDVGLNTINRLSALTAPSPEQITNPRTAREFEANLQNFVTAQGLEDFYPEGNEYVAKVAENAARMLNTIAFPGATPRTVSIAARQALYQPILYCDDSGSMKEQDRMNRQTIMVQRIASLITEAAPEESKLVHLRFINNNGKFDNLQPSELPSKMNFIPNGSTKLGTNLKAKVLDSFLYHPINDGGTLLRPLLILTVTDGCPNEEVNETFENEIKASLDFVRSNGYGEQAVKYNLSQVGNADEATQFLNSWQMNPLVPDTINVTSERLDAQFENLKDNDAELNGWILEKLQGSVSY